MKQLIISLCCFFTAIYVQASAVRTINIPGMNTYRLAVLNSPDGEQTLAGTTYNWEVYHADLKGNLLWKAKTGGFCFDMAAKDIDGDGKDDLILGCGDDSVYCYSHDGEKLWSKGLRNGPVYSVATISHENKTYILAGTVLNTLFVMDTQGEVISQKKLGGAIRELVISDFDGDGKEDTQ